MLRRCAVAIAILALLNSLITCTKTVRVAPEEGVGASGKIIAVIQPDGKRIAFDAEGGTYKPDESSIVGTDVYGDPVKIPMDDILYLQIKKADPSKTFLATVGVLAAAAAVTLVVIAATKESCPFVYSWDGQEYVLDAEPLGGAICLGMCRSESSRLDHLRPVDGEYRLMVRNEVKEHQYLDQLRLQVVDHPSEFQVTPDSLNHLYYVSRPQGPVACFDESGADLTPFVSATDGISWQSKMPVRSPAELPCERHHHTYKFVRPEFATRARLVYNIGSTLWGSNMIRETLQLRGTAAELWYEEIRKHGPAYDQLQYFLNRDELWHLKVMCQEADSLACLGTIRGAGPLTVEDRVLDIDLSRVVGDTVTIHLNLPYGFWVIDYIGMQFDITERPEVITVPLKTAVNHQEHDVALALSENDGTYYMMPEVGDWCQLVFEAPPPPADNSSRTVFLESSGYYQIQFDTIGPPNVELLKQLGETPGATVHYSFEKYLEFVDDLMASN